VLEEMLEEPPLQAVPDRIRSSAILHQLVVAEAVLILAEQVQMLEHQAVLEVAVPTMEPVAVMEHHNKEILAEQELVVFLLVTEVEVEVVAPAPPEEQVLLAVKVVMDFKTLSTELTTIGQAVAVDQPMIALV
jgi:hypothetical protein